MNIPNHEILSEISRGALTTVYKARHLNLDRLVLLKVLNKQWLGEKDLLDRFRREARISARLQHKNIVNVYDFKVSDSLVYISLEYVEGQPLSEYIRANMPVSVSRAKSILLDILNALDYAHKNGVTHRDIKPANIMLDANLLARLTDFGLASFADAPTVTEQGQSMGTPAYMPPEQIQGKSAGPQGDLYSLGVTLFETLAGENPFQKENVAATLQNILNGKTPDIRTFRKDVPDEFAEILHDMMAPNPNDRAQTAGELIQRSTTAAPSPQTHTSRKTNKRLSALVLFLLVALTSWFLWPDKQAPEILPVIPANSGSAQTTEKKQENVKNKPVEKIVTPAKKTPLSQSNVPIAVPKDKHLPAAATHGFLFVNCSPWAKVMIDGDSVDITPMQQQIRLSVGRHALRLENPGFKPYEKTIRVKAMQHDTIMARLEPAIGYVMIRVSPWAKLYINDHYKEDTPLSAPLPIAGGRAIIRLVNPTLGTIIDTINVKPGETIERHFSFLK